jgi:hypothetical protein
VLATTLGPAMPSIEDALARMDVETDALTDTG